MPRLPPAEKLPLALRKNSTLLDSGKAHRTNINAVRDEWESKKGDLEKKLAGILGVEWTLDVQPNALYPYATEGYAKDSLGSCIFS
jgi:hypothetical protein